MAARVCPACGELLARREGEKRAHFLARTYCGWDCSVAGRAIRAAERAAAEDTPTGATFDRATLLRAAHNAAPQVPASLLADILDAVEPLIASNTRRATLGPIAAHIRATRTA